MAGIYPGVGLVLAAVVQTFGPSRVGHVWRTRFAVFWPGKAEDVSRN